MKKILYYVLVPATAAVVLVGAGLASAQYTASSPAVTPALHDQMKQALDSTQVLLSAIQAAHTNDFDALENRISGIQAQLSALLVQPMQTAAERAQVASSLATLTQEASDLNVEVGAFNAKYSAINATLGRLMQVLRQLSASLG